VKPPDIGGSPPPSAPRLDSFIVFHSLPSITVIAWKKEQWLRIHTVGQQTSVQIADPVESAFDSLTQCCASGSGWIKFYLQARIRIRNQFRIRIQIRIQVKLCFQLTNTKLSKM
jgi:hypothetical protein